MYYIDTSTLISYVFTSETEHAFTRKILENLAAKKHGLYASSYTLIETCNTICRKIVKEEAKLIQPLQQYIEIYGDPEQRCRLLTSIIINFLYEKLGLNFIDLEDLYRFEPTGINKLKIPKIFKEAIELSYKINLRIKDLLHITYASILSKTHGIKFFVTRDIENFEKIKDHIEKLLQIKIILVKQT